MRSVPWLLEREISRIDTAVETVMFADIYHMREGEDSLATEYRLRGLGDVSKAEDVNVAFDNTAKVLGLVEGTARSLDTSGTLLAGSMLLNWSVLVHGLFSNDKILTWTCQARDPVFGVCLLWTPDYKVVHHYYQGSQMSYPARIDSRDFLFTNQSTKLVNSLCFGLGNATGNLPVEVTCELIDQKTNKPVGNYASVTLAAGAAHAAVTLGSAMGARLFAGGTYILRVSVRPAPGYESLLVTSWANNDRTYVCNVTLSGLDQAVADWVIPIANPMSGASLGKIALGGLYAYAATGTVVRNLDVGSVPALDGVFGWSSNVPLGTTLSVLALYGSNDATVAAETPTVPAHWALIPGPYADGMTVPSYRYLRAVFELGSNAGRDVSPQLADVVVMYAGEPLVLGTIAGAVSDSSGNRIVTAVRALNSVSASSQSLDPKMKTTMVGEMTLELAPEPEVLALAGMKLRGVRVVVRAGVNGVNETMIFYSGIVRDLAYGGGRYLLTLQDAVQISDISVPNVRHADWDAVTPYTLDALVVSGDKAYRSIQAGVDPTYNTNHAVTDAVWWVEYPSVWVPIFYVAGTHLADIALDLLANRINMADRYIDYFSLESIKTRHPTRTIIADRVFDKPVKARELLDEIARLLEAQWATRDGRMSLLTDSVADDPYVDTLTPHDIKFGLEWRRGYIELKNAVMVQSGYEQSGSSEQFTRGQAVVDAQSVNDYAVVSMSEIRDRFGLSEAELMTIAQNELDKWKDGRRVIRVTARFGKLAIEAGDLVRLMSGQLPQSEPQDINCMVVQSSLDWKAMSNQITLMEV